MGRRPTPCRAVAALALTLLSVPIVSGLVVPQAASADCGRAPTSPGIRDYRGQAFIGRLVGIEDITDPPSHRAITFDVEEVLAGDVPDPMVLVDLHDGCGVFREASLDPGERYLVSVGPDRDPDEPDHVVSALLWRSVPRGWSFDSDALWASDGSGPFPPEARAATTREEILALVAGGTVAYPTVGCPPADTTSPPASPEPLTTAPTEPSQANVPPDRKPLGGTWKALPRSPFASWSGVGAWTGDHAIFVGAEERRAVSYDPARRRWRELARPPVRMGWDASAAWHDSELLVIGSNRRAVMAIAYAPDRDRWRRLPDAPLEQEVGTIAVVDDKVVVAGPNGARLGAVAILDPDGGCWREVEMLPSGMDDLSIVGTASNVVAAGSAWPVSSRHLVARLDLASAAWSEPLQVPLEEPTGAPVWIGGERVLFTGRSDTGSTAAILDVRAGTWTVLPDIRCGGITNDTSVWTGRLLLSAWGAFDPVSGQCYTLPRSQDRNRRDPAVVWTGRELLRWSGGGGEEIPPDPDGITYRPPAWTVR